MAPVSRFTRRGLCAALALWLAATPSAHALLNLDGTRNQLFVFGGVTFGYNSNIFATANGRGDYTMSAHAGAELKRRAGLIAVNSTLKFDYVTYSQYSGENAFNPNFSLELNKTNGRTTGAFTLAAYRETRTDSAVNLRTSSWNFPLGLNIKYPINEKFYVTSASTYLRRNYASGQGLVNYSDYSEAVDLYYTYTSKLDLLAGYRIRVSNTAINSRAIDHWFNVGATGGLFSKLAGTVRFGYQLRDENGPASGRFDHWNAAASVNWPITRKLMLALQLNRDFSTIATGASVDSTSAALRAVYAYSRKVELNSGVAVGTNRFLDGTQADRRDTFFSWDAGVTYKMNDHLNFGASYTYFHNWSSLSQSDFESHGFSFDVSGRY